ncbi:hypothetical protein CYY_006316 [Polysphondylium violaceum]|uniref:Uncharacterized protein n=1 Tax=Polysphondylium violaceum TaxID=133409 RepID=A0A8J4PQN2_9MYCE|nr:hypothetical protein CYY_006316 [Polysphondylium violaceum]
MSNTKLNQEDLKTLPQTDLYILLENQTKLFHTIGPNLCDKGEKILKTMDQINSIIKEREYNRNKARDNNSFIDSIGNLSLGNANSGSHGGGNYSKKQIHRTKQISVEETQQLYQENQLNSMGGNFQELGVDSPMFSRRYTPEDLQDGQYKEVGDEAEPTDPDTIDPFEDKPYDQGYNYELHDEFDEFQDDR